MNFGTYANYYDLIYQTKDYLAEIDYLAKIAAWKPGSNILDLGCGTGGHDIPLVKRGYQVTGVDLSERMIQQAEQKALASGLAIRFLQGDIRSVRLNRKFDLVLSMFAVMSYQTSNDDFCAALQTAREHLISGGLFIFDAWYGPAVLSQMPETRVKEIELGDDERVLRIAEPQWSSIENTVTVNYTILRFAGHQVLDETHEAHPMRYFFAPEVDFFACKNGFKVNKVLPFNETERQPTEKDWNVTWVLEAV